MSSTADDSEKITVIQAHEGWGIDDIKEIKEYRDLFYFLVWKNIKVLYAQTILGFMWAVLNPFIQIIVFTIIFGNLANLDSDGIPYVLFSTVAIIPWTYMAGAMSASSQSLVAGQGMLGKIYFPRIIFPITPVLSKLVDFLISLLLLLAVMLYYQIEPTWNLVYLPLLIIMMICVPAGIGMWVSALAIRFRDVKFALPFIISMLIYTAPVIYSASSIPEIYRFIYSLNPIVGVIEGYRACLLGNEMPWLYIIPGFLTNLLILVTGARYFKKMERIFVDVI